MKKKFALMATSLVLVAALAVGGTLAYLTAKTDTVTNTFTVGKISMALDEAQVGSDGKAITGENAKRVASNSYKVYPDAAVDKDPTVTIGAKSEACYVRMLVTVTKSSTMDSIFSPTGANLESIFLGYDSSNWQYIGNTEDDANDTRTYEFRYANIVPYSEMATKLPALFTQVKIPGNLTETQLAALQSGGFNINVVAHAIQSAGFADAAAAWTAFDAQNPTA